MCADLMVSEGTFLVSKIVQQENFPHQFVNLVMKDVSKCKYERLQFLVSILGKKKQYFYIIHSTFIPLETMIAMDWTTHSQNSYPHGAIEIENQKTNHMFKVNGK